MSNDAIMTADNQLSAIVPEIWSRRFYDALLMDLPFNDVISRDYEGEIGNLGDTVKISTIPEFGEAEEVAEDQRANAKAVTVTQQNLVINKRIVNDFIVTSRAQIQSLPHMDKLRELAVFAINKKIQKIIIADTVPQSGQAISYDSGTTLALADLLEGKELLDDEDVPMEDRNLVVGSAQLNDIFNITGFTSSDFITAGAPLTSGAVDSPLLGFRPHFTTEVGSVTHMFHASYFTMAAQKGIDVEEFNLGGQGKRATRINVGWLGGFKQLGEERVVTIS